MFATSAMLAIAVGLAALLIVQRDRARANRRMLLRAIEAEARAEALFAAPASHAGDPTRAYEDTAAQRATASQFRRT